MSSGTMLFSKLLAKAGLSVNSRQGDTEVQDVQIDSRCCRDGSCFVAVQGSQADGHQFIPDAISAGALAIVCQDAALVPAGIAHAIVTNARQAGGMLAQAIADWPARKLRCIGITGTNGKTTITYMARAILAADGHAPAMLGTISYETASGTVPASTTTPDAIALARITSELAAAGRTHLVMEVSSHALDQHRTAGVEFAIGVFSNLTGDHLDYHGDMDSYLAAKLRLFEQLPSDGTAVINYDDSLAGQVAAATGANVIGYGLDGAADLRANITRADASRTEFQLLYQGCTADVRLRMIGEHNVLNALAAAGACIAEGVALETIAAALTELSCVPGRLQPVPGSGTFSVFVDYAHTDDALGNVLRSLRAITEGKLIVVFGCGGDRDKTKRPRMAAAAELLADRIVITSDNPRSEDARAIIDDIVCGLSPAAKAAAVLEPDRRSAIAAAIDFAQPGDVVLIAGKGHENYQVIGDERLNFDDVQIAGELVAMRGPSR